MGRRDRSFSGTKGKLGGLLRPVVAVLAFSSAAGVLGWLLLVPGALEMQIEERTGFPVEAEALTVNPVGLSVSGKNVVIGNPSEYGSGQPLMEIESLTASASLAALGRGEIWIDEMDLHIRRATLVVDERGRLNLDEFANKLFLSTTGNEQMPFFAETVRLKIDELVFVDNSQLRPASRSVPVRLNQELSDLDQFRDVFGPMFELARRVGSLPIE